MCRGPEINKDPVWAWSKGRDLVGLVNAAIRGSTAKETAEGCLGCATKD